VATANFEPTKKAQKLDFFVHPVYAHCKRKIPETSEPAEQLR